MRHKLIKEANFWFRKKKVTDPARNLKIFTDFQGFLRVATSVPQGTGHPRPLQAYLTWVGDPSPAEAIPTRGAARLYVLDPSHGNGNGVNIPGFVNASRHLRMRSNFQLEAALPSHLYSP